jgi:DNA-binding response OmpR family regulator
MLDHRLGVAYRYEFAEPPMTPHSTFVRRILVIDDEPGMRNLMRRGLNMAGYEVETVETGEAGLEAARIRIPDVVLLDLMMPGMGGFETLERLCALEPCPRVIVVSGRDDIEDRVQAARADLFLVKPVHFDTLLEAIQAVIDGPVMPKVPGSR